VKALLIPVDGPPREVDLPGGGTRFMRSLKALIGTECAERIRVTSRWEAWLDEDGAAAGKPVNQAATLVAQSRRSDTTPPQLAEGPVSGRTRRAGCAVRSRSRSGSVVSGSCVVEVRAPGWDPSSVPQAGINPDT
jgi:hypothetical protein